MRCLTRRVRRSGIGLVLVGWGSVPNYAGGPGRWPLFGPDLSAAAVAWTRAGELQDKPVGRHLGGPCRRAHRLKVVNAFILIGALKGVMALA